MRKIHLTLLLAATLLTQPVFADQDMTPPDSDSKPCIVIAKACLVAGYTRGGSAGKMFWKDCMKPVALGQTVHGITIDANTVKMCRADKIAKLKRELEEFQKAFSNNGQ